MEIDTLSRPAPPAESDVLTSGFVAGMTAWSVRRRWWVLLGSLVAVAAAVGVFATQGLKTATPTEQLVGDSRKAADIT